MKKATVRQLPIAPRLWSVGDVSDFLGIPVGTRDAAGKEHSRHFNRKVDAERWEAASRSAITRGDWTDPARAEVTVGV